MPKPARDVSMTLHNALLALATAAGQDPDIPVDPPVLPLEAKIGPGYTVGG